MRQLSDFPKMVECLEVLELTYDQSTPCLIKKWAHDKAVSELLMSSAYLKRRIRDSFENRKEDRADAIKTVSFIPVIREIHKTLNKYDVQLIKIVNL